MYHSMLPCDFEYQNHDSNLEMRMVNPHSEVSSDFRSKELSEHVENHRTALLEEIIGSSIDKVLLEGSSPLESMPASITSLKASLRTLIQESTQKHIYTKTKTHPSAL